MLAGVPSVQGAEDGCRLLAGRCRRPGRRGVPRRWRRPVRVLQVVPPLDRTVLRQRFSRPVRCVFERPSPTVVVVSSGPTGRRVPSFWADASGGCCGVFGPVFPADALPVDSYALDLLVSAFAAAAQSSHIVGILSSRTPIRRSGGITAPHLHVILKLMSSSFLVGWRRVCCRPSGCGGVSFDGLFLMDACWWNLLTTFCPGGSGGTGVVTLSS